MYYSVLIYFFFLYIFIPLIISPFCPAPGKAGFPGAEGGVPRWGTTRSSVPDKTPLRKGF